MSDCMLLWIVRFDYLWLRVYLLLPQELLKARPIITYAVGIGISISLCLVLCKEVIWLAVYLNWWLVLVNHSSPNNVAELKLNRFKSSSCQLQPWCLARSQPTTYCVLLCCWQKLTTVAAFSIAQSKGTSRDRKKLNSHFRFRIFRFNNSLEARAFKDLSCW